MKKEKTNTAKKKRRKKIILIVTSVVLVCVIMTVAGISIYGKQRIGAVSELSFEEALAYTTKNNSDAVITVGIIKDGLSSYKVYGENAREQSCEPHTYEIGSLTKTFTAALINRAVIEGKIDINKSIDNYLALSDDKQYPTVSELLTHTSGYKGYYFESPMIANFFKNRNDFYGISKAMVLEKVKSLNMKKEDYEFNYSNFGYAVLGLVLEAVYKCDYTDIVNSFVQNELGLNSTRVSDGSGDLGNYWDWKEDDAYMSAGALTSDITDMLAYAEMQIDNDFFAECHKSLKTINASTEKYSAMGINMDEIGMAWIIDNENGIIWHNGGTDDYNCYLGFNPATKTAVVILSNLAPGYRIPATVLGVKLLTSLA